ncbi:aminotransferase class I/II-fold pyridoxal phosphate-dependent enzyme [Flavitalea sp. BT771]|uniref:pyridoxal phosphate-dependent aminotransferase n=1 Tax=Flavitalea sp. BT771 TaxID=3063329 RepID=UPI0026E22BFA|nr:aminotransferase class I/II-fold pyridoxal phosphate-dependent enzyme [Flavitalea sp. BT771]MDO6434091.1 aminotransferase class I/II-fold pyridoxal phosphate-dependent enzyme [Flavitalea sp. BT771]MDV6222991.1 aminotransferase class I/II-fold pyridoxal phosphate-dependent enzyme [Flavitalea sp. BT771]
MLYGHGDNGYRLGGDIIADFSTNVWHGGEPAGLKEHLFSQWRQINRYPEVAGESLAVKAARHHGLTSENILVTNGATESIYLIAQAYAARRSGIVIPSFSEYEDACRMHGHKVDLIEWDHLAVPGKQELLWLGNPNNPTGAVFSQMEHLLGNHPDTLFIIDEAFIEFTRTITSAISLLHHYPNLAILRSLTKTFSIPGLRLGYIAASREIINKLQSLKMPWSVNAMALVAGHFIFDHYASIGIPLDRLLQDKESFVRQLRQDHLTVLDSHTHFFVCETSSGTARALQQYLLDECRILIRDAGNFRGLSERHFRLATLAPHQNQLLITALEKWQRKCA